MSSGNRGIGSILFAHFFSAGRFFRIHDNFIIYAKFAFGHSAQIAFHDDFSGHMS